MAILLTKIEWYRNGGQDSAITLDDFESITVKVGATPKSNNAEIKLKNTEEKYTNVDGTIMFEEDDIFKIYALHSKDGTIIDTSDTSPDLLMVAELKEISINLDSKNSIIVLKCVDRTFTLLNRLCIANFKAEDVKAPNGTGWNSPEAIQNIIRNATDNSVKHIDELFTKDGAKGGIYEIDARMFIGGENIETAISSGTTTLTTSLKLIDSGATFETDDIEAGFAVYNTTDKTWSTVKSVDSETQLTLKKDIFVSGESYQINDAFIQHKRPNLGTADTDTDEYPGTDLDDFPLLTMGRTFKPVYEVCNELSETKLCNTVDERDEEDTSATLVVRRSMRYFIDEKQRFHWFYPDTTPELYISQGIATAISPDTDIHKILRMKGKKAVYDVINFIIFRAGTDMNGAQILGYAFDKSSENLNLKDSYRAMVSIAERMKKEDLDAGNITKTTTGDSRYYSYPANYGGGITPAWNELITVTSDATYNSEFRNEATKRGKASANALIHNRGRARWKINVTLVGENITPADLIMFNTDRFGIVNTKLRLNEVTQDIRSNGWTTVITLEEDALEVEN